MDALDQKRASIYLERAKRLINKLQNIISVILIFETS